MKPQSDKSPKQKATETESPQGESGDGRSADSHAEATPSEHPIVQSIGPEGPPPRHQNRGPEIAAAIQNL